VAAALILLWSYMTHYSLVLRDISTGKIYGSYPVRLHDEFSVSFTHSVNKTPVTDQYRINSPHDIHNYACKYYGFGAGVQTELGEGETLRYEGDAMVVENINKHFDHLLYGMKPASSHHLLINGEDIFLPELLSGPANVVFEIKHTLL